MKAHISYSDEKGFVKRTSSGSGSINIVEISLFKNKKILIDNNGSFLGIVEIDNETWKDIGQIYEFDGIVFGLNFPDSIKQNVSLVNREDQYFLLQVVQLSREELDEMRLIQEFSLDQNKFLEKNISDLDLSPRLYNCLNAIKFNFMKDVLVYEREHRHVGLLKLRNFGSKNLTELEELFKKVDIPFGRNRT